MKTTIELPDKLMNEVADLAEREQRDVSDVVADLLRAGLENRKHQNGHHEHRAERRQQMLNAFALADELFEDTPSSPTARELLEDDRNRLERN